MDRKPYLIGITGGSGSGKTTFIRQLRSAFSETDLCVLSQDDYYRPKEEQQLDELGISNFDLPESIERKAFYEDVQRLLKGETIARPEYVFNNDKARSRLLAFRSAPLIILEGIFVFYYPEIWELLDLSIFLHAKEDLKIVRRIERDRRERNYPLEDVLYRYVNHVSPTFEKYIKPFQERADIVINNNDHFETGLEVVKGFLRQKLVQVHTVRPPMVEQSRDPEQR
ncbi:MAG: uridine kinase [Saprospiraceae bacterium]|nr:uridine kinase [Saprospiraceae bacterium]MCB0626613.1 uridine kinase [Saprospiraceae bacterium]MCB0679572.1 uridine kinase [Saprospiraceae bacterium]